MKRIYQLSASIICDNFVNLGSSLKLLRNGGIDYIHFDVMDGLFVPRYGLFPELLQTIKKVSKIPVDVHLMVQNPDPYIKVFADAGADIITIHAEATPHLSRSLHLIKGVGVGVGIALNPATSLNVLDYITDDLDLIMLMAINPGIVGHKLIPKTYDKIRDLKDKLGNNKKMIIQIDGGVTPVSAPEMVKAGANMLVCGTSTIFMQKKPLDKMIIKLKKTIDELI